MATPAAENKYVPAAGHDWALPFYDPLVKALGGEPTREALIRQANIRPGQRVLEIGCGTGTVLLRIKREHPDANVVGLDPDPKALERARRKAERAGAVVTLDRGFAGDLPYPAASFDRVLSSFMFHHLSAAEKERTLREASRVLKPGGALHMVDFAGHRGRSGGFLGRLLHSSEPLEDNAEDHVLDLMRANGFAAARRVGEGRMLFGHIRINYFEAVPA